MMVKITKKEKVIKCPWCRASSSFVFVQGDAEHCQACKRDLNDKEKRLEK